MLVLTRRVNQSIKIGDDIEIMVIEVRGDQVRLGVTAPRSVGVHRKEIYLQIQQDKNANVQPSLDMDAIIGDVNSSNANSDELAVRAR